MNDFNGINLPLEIVSSLERMSIIKPTEIQKKTIPIALEGLDLLASSHTGSGKTLAYLLPAIVSIIKHDKPILVMVPTRELASQVQQTLIKVADSLKITNVMLIGGESISKQLFCLKRSPMAIIATPGRLIDHLQRGSLKVTNVNMVILDEMDRMLDMGMKDQLEEVNNYLPEKKQVLMFSATMPPHIIEMSKKYLSNPERIAIGSTTKASVQIKQETMHVEAERKFPELIKQLKERTGSIIVFVKTKNNADRLAKMLKLENLRAEAIHGDLSQSKRTSVILSFRQARNRIMVATDLAARGLDIPHTQHVINYDLPMCPEDYLHRIGRTGRGSNTGNALSFISPEDGKKWRAIDRLMKYGETTDRQNIEKPRNNQSFLKRPRNETGRRDMLKGRKY